MLSVPALKKAVTFFVTFFLATDRVSAFTSCYNGTTVNSSNLVKDGCDFCMKMLTVPLTTAAMATSSAAISQFGCQPVNTSTTAGPVLCNQPPSGYITPNGTMMIACYCCNNSCNGADDFCPASMNLSLVQLSATTQAPDVVTMTKLPGTPGLNATMLAVLGNGTAARSNATMNAVGITTTAVAATQPPTTKPGGTGSLNLPSKSLEVLIWSVGLLITATISL